MHSSNTGRPAWIPNGTFRFEDIVGQASKKPDIPNIQAQNTNLAAWWDDGTFSKKGKKAKKIIPKKKESDDENEYVPVIPRRPSDDDLFYPEPLPPELEEIPLIILEQKSPPIWTIGISIVFIVIFFCEIVQAEGISLLGVNPLIGPSESTLLLMGAKYGPSIVNGEWWRLFSSVYLHSGIIHLFIVLVFLFATRNVEIGSGFWRAFLIFMLAGVYSNVLSSIMVPEIISSGSTGAIYGYFGLQFSDLISSWRIANDKWNRFSWLCVCFFSTIIAGLTPYLDNFMHIGGFVVGFLFALMLLPNMSFGEWESICHGFIAFLAFPVLATVFMFSLVFLFRSTNAGSSWCSWCHYMNCINISGWCPAIKGGGNQNTFYLK